VIGHGRAGGGGGGRSSGARGTRGRDFRMHPPPKPTPCGGDAGGPHRHLWDNGETSVGIPTMGRPLAV